MTSSVVSGAPSVPKAECDLIMKGGITSGVVYPPAVLALKEAYRFRSIGGTSAGAIAAALTAAAELGRTRGGFEALDQASRKLGEKGFLLSLFRATGGTGPLFRFMIRLLVLVSGNRKGPAQALIAVHKGLAESATVFYGLGVVLGASMGLALAAGIVALLDPPLLARTLGAHGILALFMLTDGWAVMALVCLVLGVAILAPVPGLIRLLWILVRTVPANYLGICRGTRLKPTDSPALTEWLHEQLQRCAGRTIEDPPLTFGDLWRGPSENPTPGTAETPCIDLRMVTSCLSQHQPYVLPFGQEVFAIRDLDAALFFPPDVVKALRDNAPAAQAGFALPDGYRFLPFAADLPVLVTVRMSLSFPVLFSAVPLYSLPVRSAGGKPGAAPVTIPADRLQLNWFSDGGICSNFPIHFFDRWLPRRPTFGISLTSLPAEGFVGAGRVSNDYLAMSRPSGRAGVIQEGAEAHNLFNDPVYLPRAGDEQAPEWSPLGDSAGAGRHHPDLFRFLGAAFTTAQSYRDNAQSLLPSYRERVVQIRLREDEGGLNLDMPPATIQRIVDHGRVAGTVLRDHFNFAEHQWVRYRVLLAELEKNLGHMQSVVAERKPFWLGELGPMAWGADETHRFAYPRPDAWFQMATSRLEQLLSVAEGWSAATHFQESPPEPRPELRMVPSG